MRVLVVDDSAVVRQLLSSLLNNPPHVEVAVASDPIIAAAKIARCRPDVIVLDLEMPRIDGLTFLRTLMADDPLPVVVCSGHTGPGTELALAALEHGAVDVVSKPALGMRGFLEQSARPLLETLRSAAASADSLRRRGRPAAVRVGKLAPPRPITALDGDRVIGLGASTGGTEALRILLGALPASLPGILIVQHMPPGFTSAFAERLDRCSALEVREARDGDRVRPGTALVAPGGRQLEVACDHSGYRVVLHAGPEVSRHRPSVDALFTSLAREAGPGAVAALLTGMGDDGARGLLELRRAGATTIAQDESSSVIFGMPREAIALGAAERIVPLGEMADVLERACAPRRARWAERAQPKLR